MGQSSSKKKHGYDFSERQPLVPKVAKRDPKAYSLPEQRKKRRYKAIEKNPPGAYEASIDKYDYLLIFPFTEGEYREPRVDDERDLSVEERRRGVISWRRARAVWQRVIPGSAAQKEEALVRLQAKWEKYSGYKCSDEELMYYPAWRTLAREALLDQLANKNGLQLKFSANTAFVFCRVRAPLRLLEQQADLINYPLKLRDQVDPGSDSFWNLEYKGRSVELEEERRLLSKEEALDVLDHLYRAGKVPPSEVEVNEQLESQAAWSRRVHTLERIADAVPVSNRFPAYSSLHCDRPQLRHLYQTYATVRGEALLLPKDRLLLTKSIVDHSIDTEKMKAEDLLIDFFPLHDANRGEQLTIDGLRHRWVNVLLTPSRLVGAPMVSHPAYEDDVELWFFWRPFAQPLKSIREYFGEEIALFYAWYGFFTFALLFPALMSAAMELLFYFRGYTDTVSNLDWPKIAYAVALITWAMLYVLLWFRENYAVALKWGTVGFESEEADRPQFTADEKIKTVLSNVDSSRVTYYPESRRVCLQLASNLAICALIATVMCLLLAVQFAEAAAVGFEGDWWGTVYVDWVVVVVLALIAQVASLLFQQVATALNDNENYRTATAYDDALVQKVVLFDLCVNLFMCYFTAYGKGPLLGTCYNECMGDLRRLLYAIIIVRVSFTLLQAFGSIIAHLLKIHRLQAAAAAAASGGRKAEQKAQMKAQHDEEDVQFELELRLLEPDSTLASFSACYMQFAFINLFSTAVPLLPIIALGENLFLLRVRALYLCKLARRPHPELAEDAGKWAEYMELIVYLGVYTTTATFVFGLRDMDQYGLYTKAIIFLSTSLVLMAFTQRLKLWLPAEPQSLQEVRQRQQFVVDKYVNDFEDDDEDLVAPAYAPDALDDAVDVDGLNLYTMRSKSLLTLSEKQRLHELESKRRSLLMDLRRDREQLQTVYGFETYDKAAGVGRKKSTQLPLGRLQVRLLSVDDLDDGDLVDYDYSNSSSSSSSGGRREIKFASKRFELFVRVSFRDLDDSSSSGGINFSGFLGFGASMNFSRDLTDSRAFKLDPSRTTYDFEGRALGPFSPIRKQNYAVVFHLMQRSIHRSTPQQKQSAFSSAAAAASDGAVPRFVAECNLSELADQQQHQLCLLFGRCDYSGNRALNDELTDVKLTVQLTFQYSKILPLKLRLRENEQRLRVVEKELASIESGGVDSADIKLDEQLLQEAKEAEERALDAAEADAETQAAEADANAAIAGTGAATQGNSASVVAGGDAEGAVEQQLSAAALEFTGASNTAADTARANAATTAAAASARRSSGGSIGRRRGNSSSSVNNPEAGDLDDINAII